MMWDIIQKTLASLNLQGLGNFLQFVMNREKIILTFSPEQRRLINAVTFVIDRVRIKRKNNDICDMAQFATEYVQTLLDSEDRKDIEVMLIELGKTLEIKHTQDKDPWLKKLSDNTFKSGELGLIAKL